MAKKKIGKRLRNFSTETRFHASEKFKEKLLKMFKGYVKCVVLYGSIVRGDFTGKSDVDVYIIFDDTKMPLKKFDDVREKINGDVYKIARATDPRLHPQPVIALTEFWDGMRHLNSFFYNIVREGYAIYDTGFFIPMRKMLEWGKFPTTTEAAEMRMESIPKRLARVEHVKVYMVAEDLGYGAIDAAQAVLMYIGVAPPVPKVLPREFRKHLVEPGIVEEKYAKFLEEILQFRKDAEHKKVIKLTGKEVDEWIKRSKDYFKRMDRLLKELEISKKAGDIKKTYEIMIKATVAALKSMKQLPPEPENLPKAFKDHMVDKGLINPMYGDVFGKVLEMRKKLEDKKLGDIKDRDVYMSKEYIRRFVVDVRRIIEDAGPPQELEAPKEDKKVKPDKKTKKKSIKKK